MRTWILAASVMLGLFIVSEASAQCLGGVCRNYSRHVERHVMPQMPLPIPDPLPNLPVVSVVDVQRSVVYSPVMQAHPLHTVATNVRKAWHNLRCRCH